MKDTDQIERLTDLIESAGLDLRTDYSGRAMYGDRCLAFDYEGSTAGAIADLIDATQGDIELVNELADALRGSRSDSMGLGSVLYFPSYQTGKADDEE